MKEANKEALKVSSATSSEANSTKKGDAAVKLSRPVMESSSKPLAAVDSAVPNDKPSSLPKIDPLKRFMQIVRESISTDPKISSKPIVVDGSKAFAESYLNGKEQQDRLSAQFDGLTIPGSSPK